MRKLLSCAAFTAALILAANAADTAARKPAVPATPAKTQAAPKPAATVAKTGITPKTVAKPALKPGVRAGVSSKPTTAANPTTGSKATAAGTVGSRTSTAARHPATPLTQRRPTTSWRNRQAEPTPERYKEIQDALAAKGYLQPESASGHWDQTSIDALRKFQADQKLDSTGKLNSLSLIALGLGPKYEAPALPVKPAESTAPTVTPTENTAPTVTPVETR